MKGKSAMHLENLHMNDNIMVPLSEVAKIDISGVDKKTKENEIPVSLCNFTDVYYNWSITKNMVPGFMKATANKKEIDRFSLTKGQVVITKDSETRDDIGMSAYIADDLPETILGYHCAVIAPDEKVLDGRYLNAYLSSQYGRKYFEYKAGGSGQRYTLTVEGISNIKIPLIPLSEQKKIGKFLSNLDKKIENNNAISSQLESLAKTIYDYWFLQFDFPDENGNPYRSSGGKMVWNDGLKREIPEGWEVVNLFDCADVLYGYPLRTEMFNAKQNGLPVVRIRDILNNSISAYTSESIPNKYLTECGDLLIGMDGNFQMNYWSNNGDCINQRIVRIREKNIPVMIIKMQIEPFINAKVHNVARSRVAHLSDKDLKSLKILIPDNKLDISLFKTFIKEIVNLKADSKICSSLRDFLLPLLMNGQVTIE